MENEKSIERSIKESFKPAKKLAGSGLVAGTQSLIGRLERRYAKGSLKKEALSAIKKAI